jgi:hypothetical protein
MGRLERSEQSMERLKDGRAQKRMRHLWLLAALGVASGGSLIYAWLVTSAHWLGGLYLGLLLLLLPIGVLVLPGMWRRVRACRVQAAPGAGLKDAVLVGVTPDGRRRAWRWSPEQREAPTLILGGTRRGKSSLASHLISQDIQRGDAVVVVDPHRDLAVSLLPACAAAGRDVIWFEPGARERVPAYNPLETAGGWTPRARAQIVVEATRRIWFPFEGEVPVRVSDTMTHMLHLLAANELTLLELPRALRQKNFRNYLARIIRDPGLREWLCWFNQLTSHQRHQQVTSSLMRLNDLIHHPEVALVLGQRRSSIDMTQITDGRRVLLAALSAARLQSAAYLIGGLLTTDLISTLMRRLTRPFDERQRVYVTLDEFDQMVPEGTRDFISQAGKTGCSLTLIGQTRRMIDAQLRDVVTANCTNRAIFGVTGPEAQAIARELFEPDPTLIKDYSVEQRPIFYTPQEQWAFYAARLQELRPHTFFAISAADGEPRRLQLPSFEPVPAEELEALRRRLAADCTRPRDEVLEEIGTRREKLDGRFGPMDAGIPIPPGKPEPRPREHAPY